MYERDAQEKGIAVDTFIRPLNDVDRASPMERRRFRQDPRQERDGEILGATIVARHAGEMLNEITLAIVGEIGLEHWRT